MASAPHASARRRSVEEKAMIARTSFAALAALAGFMGSAVAGAWPERPVRIIYPYAAGGTGDATARLIARRLSDGFGQPFIVENRVGANGAIATEAVARSAPDGYTLLWAITPQIAISPAIAKVPYDPVTGFAAISAVSTNKFALIVNAKVPAKTVPEFVEYVRAQSKGFTYAEGGAGSISHLSMVLLLSRAGLEGTNVSYKGGAPALTDVIAGHLPAMFTVFGDALSQRDNGAIRMLAVSSATRSEQAPDVPTIAESGFPGFQTLSWWGLMAPARTPKAIVERIATEVGKATREPKIVERLTAFGVDPVGDSPAEFSAMISADVELWARAVKIAGLQAE
jgi:tripartite-type tricarboxylate transporter receptor subunit TctC